MLQRLVMPLVRQIKNETYTLIPVMDCQNCLSDVSNIEAAYYSMKSWSDSPRQYRSTFDADAIQGANRSSLGAYGVFRIVFWRQFLHTLLARTCLRYCRRRESERVLVEPLAGDPFESAIEATLA